MLIYKLGSAFLNNAIILDVNVSRQKYLKFLFRNYSINFILFLNHEFTTIADKKASDK